MNNCCCSEPQEARESQISSAYGELYRQIERLERSLKIHGERINPTLRPEKDSCVKDPQQTEKELKAPLANVLLLAAAKIELAAAMIEALTLRIEL